MTNTRDHVRSLGTRRGAALLSAILLSGAIGCWSDGEFTGPEARRWSTGLAVTGEFVFDTANAAARTVPNGNYVPRLGVVIRAQNVGNTRLEGISSAGSCTWWLRVYDNPAREGAPVWRSEDDDVFCRTIITPVEFDPGQIHEFGVGGPTLAFLRSGDPATQFYVTGVLKLGTPDVETTEFHLGVVSVP
ncbi:MAG: hypothetical protein WD043_04575 [Gemmatimonadales bacterium]